LSGQSKVVVSDLKDDWMYFNNEYNTFFPLLSNEKRKLSSVSQLVDLKKYSLYKLNFEACPGLSFYVNNKLVYNNSSAQTREVSIGIDSLPKSTGNEKDLLSFYNPSGKLPINHTFIGTISKVGTETNLEKGMTLHPRNIDSSHSYFIIFFLIIITGIAVLKNRYPKKFYELFHFSNLIPEMDENVVWDLSSFPILLFIVINSLCVALILFVINNQFGLNSTHLLNILDMKSVVGILMVTGAFFLIYLIKYFQLKVAGWIFNLKEIVKIQFFELMKVSLKINMFLTVLILIFYSSGYFKLKIGFDYFIYFTIFSLLIVLFRVGYLTFTLTGFRNIYLFSYLCTTEIVPLVILVKLILL
jgi:hypothetical protein